MYLLIFREREHLFSFYVNSAKKKIVIGGDEGDILFPPEMRGSEMILRKEFNFEKKDYSWCLFPVSGNFKKNGKDLKGGEIFEGNDAFSTGDFSFSFSPISNLNYSSSQESSNKFGNTLVMEDEPAEFKNVSMTYSGKSKTFIFRSGRTIKIGRKNTDIPIGFDEVSGEHVLFEMKENGLYFWNKGKNGTWVNGVKTDSGVLEEGKYFFSIAGRHDVIVSLGKEKTSESYYIGSLSPQFEQVETWLNQPVLFANHPIILLTGESGTGKEVFAEFIHRTSGRKGQFVTYNTASIPETLVESELFGTVKGSFTGAEEREGAFISADGGTLFLDEIAEMPMNLQSKLLRILEDWMVRRIGESGQGRKVDVTLILATNKDLEKAVVSSTFRKDLFYRLSTLHLHIPPLRNRKEDILPLGRHIHSALRGKELEFDKDAEKKLLSYDWPGNVRELKSVITRFAYTGKDTFSAKDFPY